MANNRIKMKSPSGTVIETSADMVEYFSKMGYSKVTNIDNKRPIINNMKKNKDTK